MLIEPGRLEPAFNGLTALPQRGLLYCFEGSVLGLNALQHRAPFVDQFVELDVLFAQLANIVDDVGDRTLELPDSLSLTNFLLGKFLKGLLQVLRARLISRVREFLMTIREALNP